MDYLRLSSVLCKNSKLFLPLFAVAVGETFGASPTGSWIDGGSGENFAFMRKYHLTDWNTYDRISLLLSNNSLQFIFYMF